MSRASRLLLLTLLLAAASDAQTVTKPKPWFGFGFTWHRDQAKRVFLLVEKVTAAGPASRAGIRPGDIITHLNDVQAGFGDELDLLLFLGDRKPGERLVLRCVRAGKPVTVALTIGTMPPSAVPGWERALAAARQQRRNVRGR
ncbi:MAG TPA: PDZ domain-containing protein [Thermoanaerobaculia bacterium]